MPFNGSGTFTRNYNWVADKNQNLDIIASRMDGEDDNFATGLSNCITKDGQTVITQNIPFNSKKITNLANGVDINDAINLGQLQNNQFLYLGTTSSGPDALYTLNPNPSITSYATTQQFTAKIHTNNFTVTPFLQISGIANPSSTAVVRKLNASKTEVALEIDDLLANGIYKFQRNSANNAWIVLNPEKPFLNLQNGTIATETNAGIQTLLPIGSIITWCVPTIPSNFLICDGSEISRTTYNNLFNRINVYYGAGNGSTTFRLPDYRGIFLRANDNGRGVDPNRNLGSSQEMDIQSHSHFISVTNETLAGGGATISSTRPGGIQINTNAVGGAETRPKNTSVYFLIKHS